MRQYERGIVMQKKAIFQGKPGTLNWLATSCYVTLRSLVTKSSTFGAIVGVTALVDLPGLSLSLTLVLSSLNCKTHKRFNGICRL